MKALDKEGLDYLANKVYDAINSGGSADYIVEEGTSGIWTYRKWASGIAECWGQATHSGTWTQWGSLYALPFSSLSYPFTFYNIPVVMYNSDIQTSGANSCWAGGYAGATETEKKQGCKPALFRPLVGDTTSYSCHIYVRGLWKEFTPSVSGSTYSPIDLQALNANALQYKKCSALNITNTNDMTVNGIYSGYSLTNAPQTGWMLYLVLLHDSNSQYIEQIAFPVGAPAKFWRRTLNGNGGWSAWNVYNQN